MLIDDTNLQVRTDDEGPSFRHLQQEHLCAVLHDHIQSGIGQQSEVEIVVCLEFPKGIDTICAYAKDLRSQNANFRNAVTESTSLLGASWRLGLGIKI